MKIEVQRSAEGKDFGGGLFEGYFGGVLVGRGGLRLLFVFGEYYCRGDLAGKRGGWHLSTKL